MWREGSSQFCFPPSDRVKRYVLGLLPNSTKDLINDMIDMGRLAFHREEASQ